MDIYMQNTHILVLPVNKFPLRMEKNLNLELFEQELNWTLMDFFLIHIFIL